MRFLIFLTINIISISLFAQVQSVSDTDFKEANFNNFTTLKEDLKSVQIIGLGESSHFMGETYRSKVKMVKFLHEQCGFDVLAFESPLYDLKKYYQEEIVTGKATIDSFVEDGVISGVWMTDDMIELFGYILETQKTERPLIYSGFDRSFFRIENYLDDLYKEYGDFISTLNQQTNSQITVDSIFKKSLQYVASKSYSVKKIPVQDTLILHKNFEEVKYSLNKLESKNSYHLFWERTIANLQSVYRQNYKLAYRDFEMAENINYLIDNEFPDKKIILWAATIHLLPEKNTVQSLVNNGNQYTGYFLREKFKEKYYHLAFIPAGGVTGLKGYLGIAKKRIKAKKYSIEKHIKDTTQANYAFLSTRHKVNQEVIINNNIRKSTFLGLTAYNVDVINAADGYFYMAKEYLPTFDSIKNIQDKYRERYE